MNRPEFIDYWAYQWGDLLRIQSDRLQKQGAAAFHGWVREQVAKNTPRTQAERRRETQAAVMSAAVTLLIEIGYARFSASAVAARAGVSRGALEHYFLTGQRPSFIHWHDESGTTYN